MEQEPEKSMEEVIRQDGRFPPEAFSFLHEGLSRAVKGIYGDEPRGEGQRHVSGPQLCLALRDLAIERWGLMAKVVLSKWGIRGTLDFGHMVYLLVEHNFMRKTAEDSLEDFRDVFDFEEAFGDSGQFELKE